ncbi:MAG: ABC transporter substrate-binding protein [Desulfobacteraceae bacterium]|nr:ABC transporter substrate-binding protein [Desulfobacteraceae bacterium]
MKKNAIIILCQISFIFLFFSGTELSASPPENQDPVKIVLNNWTSQRVMSIITGKILEHMGYSVEYRDASEKEQWGGLQRGIYHVQVEIWEGTMKGTFDKMVKLGGMTDAGSHFAKTREEWWYPSYVEEQCPGLPDWKALKRCYSLFATPETSPKGRYLAGPWERPDEARIRALGLNFKVVVVKHGDDLRDELEKAIKNKTPIVLFNWTPNWIDVKYSGKFIEFPAYEPECETDPRWGINPIFHQDCGNPKDGWLKKGVWTGMIEKWPCAFKTIQNITFTNLMIANISLWVDIENMTYEEAAIKWLEENAGLWKSWIPQTCTK